MAKSHKPVVWFPFAAGGTVIAFFIPVIVLLTFLAALGHVPAGLGYESMHAFARSGLGKLIIFGVVALSLWSSAHRLRCTCYDFGLRADTLVATVLYVAAIIGSIAAALFLLTKAEAIAIVNDQVGVIVRDWDAVCAEGGLTPTERAYLWRRQFLNPFAFEGAPDGVRVPFR